MLSKSMIWLTAPIQQRSKSVSDWLSATVAPPVFRRNIREAIGGLNLPPLTRSPSLKKGRLI